MKTRTKVSASSTPALVASGNSAVGAADVAQPASNATRQLEKPRARRKAGEEQAVLQAKGPDALPVSDYPLKTGPVAANAVDLREQKRSRLRG